MRAWVFAVFCVSLQATSVASAGTHSDPYQLFEKPGKMVRLPQGNALSLYCSGTGSPTIILESGFRGGTYAEWYKLQPVLSVRHRTCSYDRAGYGFSELGSDLPRDLEHQVRDLHVLLQVSGEKRPYVLVGHSNGGLTIGAFADLYPKEVAGLIFLDAAVALKQQPVEAAAGKSAKRLDQYLRADIQQVDQCRKYAVTHDISSLLRPENSCIDVHSFDNLPPAMTHSEISNEEKLSYWKALLSESECNYRGKISAQAVALLPHHWRNIPIRVVTAAVPEVNDAKAAELFGIPTNDKAALNSARASRRRWEERQAEVCQFSKDCRVAKIATTMHQVQNADPNLVAKTIEEITRR